MEAKASKTFFIMATDVNKILCKESCLLGN